MTNREDEYLKALARIERNQAEFTHELTQLRADLAMLTSRQNSRISEAKKKPAVMLDSFRRWPLVL